MDMRRDLVIKVKYGDSLKRFAASVNGSYWDYNMAKMRDKIIMAFNLNPSTEFILTYTDTDGDTVMLNDDEDLWDAAINQKLNPLRINVQLKSQSKDAPATEPSSVPPLHGLNQIGASLEEALRSLPEPLNSTISKFSEDIITKTVSSSVLTELISAFSKVATPEAAQPAKAPAGNSSRSESSTKGAPANASTKGTQTSSAVEKGKEPVVVPVPVKGFEGPENGFDDHWRSVRELLKQTPKSSTNGTKGKEPMEVPISDKGAETGFANTSSGKETDDNNDSDKKAACKMRWRGRAAMPNVSGPQPAPPPMQHGPYHHPFAFPGLPPFCPPPPPPTTTHPAQLADFAAYFGSRNAPFVPNPEVPPYPRRFIPPRNPYRKADEFESMFSACHKGIACDGCDMSPIVGPRYKSVVKDDYDLCAACFSCFGKEAEYTKIDKPNPSNMTRDFNPHPKFQHVVPSFCAARGTQKLRSKLESRFIQDVTVVDGTIVAPSTPFTKIWRMRNNGSSLWPFGTQLVWVGGDQFSSQNYVQLEIPVTGLPHDEEVDVAVDFCAPARAGRYISYWRLATPSGQKFGQRVWVLVQVEQPNNNTKQDDMSSINLNQLPESCDADHTERVEETTETQNMSEPTVKTGITGIEYVADATQGSIAEPVADVTEGPIAEPEPETAAANGPSPAVSYPLIDLSPSPTSATKTITVNEDELLKELEEMGFKQIDLNKEVLRLNKYDLEQSVGDLCGFSEWDPLLEELIEMGFDDKEKNKKLLVKNGGSIKRVVMDLIAGEKKV